MVGRGGVLLKICLFTAFLSHARRFHHDANENPASHFHQSQKTVSHSATPALPFWVYDSCKNVYLDIGSNLGVQVRKLFQPAQHTPNKLETHLRAAFGPPNSPARKAVCAVGFEPNPAHWEKLKNIATAYGQRGWRSFFVTAGAWDRETELRFDCPPQWKDCVGGHMRTAKWAGKPAARAHDANGDEDGARGEQGATVATVVLSRLLGGGKAKMPFVGLAKMDIEGAEWVVLQDLIKHDMLCRDKIAKVVIGRLFLVREAISLVVPDSFPSRTVLSSSYRHRVFSCGRLLHVAGNHYRTSTTQCYPHNMIYPTLRGPLHVPIG